MEKIENKLTTPKLLIGLTTLLSTGCDYGERLVDQLRWGAPYWVENNLFNPNGFVDNTVTYLVHAFANAG